MPLQLVGVIAATVAACVTGVVLTRQGRPYRTALLTAHKIIDLATIVIVAAGVYRAGRALALATPQLLLVGMTAVFVVAILATGGIVSATESPPWAVGWVHRFGSWFMCALLLGTAWVVLG